MLLAPAAYCQTSNMDRLPFRYTIKSVPASLPVRQAPTRLRVFFTQKAAQLYAGSTLQCHRRR